MNNKKYPLADLSAFHDACGTGFIAEVSGKPSRRVVTSAIASLKRLAHRGATGADNKTGDGSGILTDIPQEFFSAILKKDFQTELQDDEVLAIGMVFELDKETSIVEKTLNATVLECGMRSIGVRDVPINREVLGEVAKSSCPVIRQFLIACPQEGKRPVESRLYFLRKATEKSLRRKGVHAFICSLSSKSIIYKGLMSSSQIDLFYLDLLKENYTAKMAVFHERYSTNTTSTWEMAQPFRLIAHNGEINTIKGNRLWMEAREREMNSPYWNDDLETLKPIISQTGSDSLSLDNTLEFLCQSGMSAFHGMMMLVPDPYLDSPSMSPELKNFYTYHENLMEPWDGPAAIVFTDGDYVGAKLDRNGLRPLRYTLTKDGLVIMASEAGVVDVDANNLILHHHMSPGEIFAVSLDGDGILEDEQIKSQVSNATSYSDLISDSLQILDRNNDKKEFGLFDVPQDGFDRKLHIALGWTKEDLSRFLIPMSEKGQEPIGSMGDDTPPAFISEKDRGLYDYFKQSFAQVTNPPIDSIRERLVMSLSMYIGGEQNFLAKKPSFNGALRISSPVLSPREMQILMGDSHRFPSTKIFCHLPIDFDFGECLEALKKTSEKAVHAGNKIIFLSDERCGENVLPIPMPLMLSTIHHHLIEKKIRSKVSLIAIAGDAVEDHHAACLVGFGATAVYPYTAYEIIREHFSSLHWEEKMGNYRRALENGLLKVISKMGVSTTRSYHGSMLFHGLGLSKRFLERYFPTIDCKTGGIDLPEIKSMLLKRNEKAYSSSSQQLEDKGLFRYRKQGERHGFAPGDFKRIHKLAAGDNTNGVPYSEPVYIRNLLDISKTEPVKIDKVEAATELCKRFGASAISFGAISDIAHRTLAKGMFILGGRSNTGEGGETPDRYALNNPDRSYNCYVKQVASARFGLTADYLRSARELQIKMAQGSKPGEGGQLPGYKVTAKIASARSSTPGIALISPPPHHDIYSIEDIAQLIYDLKQVNPQCQVSVKLVSQPGIGLVASGVVKAGSDVVLVSGADGGTGASPLGSIKHTGLPWELGLAETHQTLSANNLRSSVTLRVDGGLKVGRDVIIAGLLGAEEFDFGTSALIAIGCVMARQCHLNTCPAGIATQDEQLWKKFKGTPEHVVTYLTKVAEEVRILLSEMGFESLDQIIGRNDLLSENSKHKSYIDERRIDLSAILNRAASGGLPIQARKNGSVISIQQNPHIDEEILKEIRPAIITQGPVVVKRSIKNIDRAVGTRLAGELAFLYSGGQFRGSIQYQLDGVAGQSFGAFLTRGIELRLQGVANDYVGKGMNGGVISIRVPKSIRHLNKNHTLMGNVSLYGATGGKLLVAGKAGERFAVRNSGAAAVVEGVGNHCCEYMTQGAVIVLGEFGQNFGSGMTGGIAFLYKATKRSFDRLNHDYVKIDKLTLADASIVQRLLRSHQFHTGSIIADFVLGDWENQKNHISKVVPLAMETVNFEEIYNKQVSANSNAVTLTVVPEP